ncbi:hypothetical protein ACQKP0_21795 [Heyndrickxia sp. NPDC080065]|uniref:hypothetical protein n=1 Tax=Heyndrickxia sp. NPDC080065 TaxID=3390568 RepID=UPI003D086895
MKTILEGFSIYNRNFYSIIILSLSITLPFLIIHNIISGSVYQIATITGADFVADFTNLLLMLLLLVIVQVPFIQLVKSDLEGDEKPLRKAYGAFLNHGSAVFLFSVIFSVAVVFGLLLLIIPGILFMVLFYLTPQIMIFEEKPMSKSFKKARKIGKRYFFSLLTIIIFTSLIDVCAGFLGLFAISAVTNSYLAIISGQMLINMIVFPFNVIVVSLFASKWKQELETSPTLDTSNKYLA